MKTVSIPVFVTSVICAFAFGTFLGFGTSKLGERFVSGMFEQEKRADVSVPKLLERDGFRLSMPGNWHVDVEDEDYDPDHGFSIDSPGAAFVRFSIGRGEIDPIESLGDLVSPMERLLDSPPSEYFEKYGIIEGKGAVLKGRILTIPTTVRVFAFSREGVILLITEEYPDEDRKLVAGGLALIERSFELKAAGSGDR